MSAENPVFVYGALRSGSTLLHLMLDAHPSIHSASEADYLFDHITPDPVSPGGWRYDRDALARDWIFRDIAKLTVPEGQGTDLSAAILAQLKSRAPDQMLSVNLHRGAQRASALFPNAKVIHLLRDPRDVARSSIGMGWTGNSFYGVDHWIGTERDWDLASFPADQVYEIKFEDLMQDLEARLSDICQFLGLPFDAAMLDYHLNSTYGPPDPKIAQKWKTKASPSEIALLEGKLGDLLAARGYAPNGTPKTPGPIESLKLAAGHRLNRWQFNIRRYGAPLFFKQHLARLLGLKGMQARVTSEMETIHQSFLK